jgi:hypothetical protein
MTTRTKPQTSQQDDTDRAARRPERQHVDARAEPKRPYDSDELKRVPRPRDDDPPYRPWWVIGLNSFDGAR